MSDLIPETTVFLVNNGGEYDSYRVLALYTDKAMAEEYAAAASGAIEEWTANVSREKWTFAEGQLNAKKANGKWLITNLYAWDSGASLDAEDASACLGHYSGWNEPDPKTGEYTYGYAYSTAKTQNEAKRMCLDAFTKLVAKLDNGTAIEVAN